MKLRTALKKRLAQGTIWQAVGLSMDAYREHLQKLWKPGMNWENYGSEWCLALVVPKRKFDFNKPGEVRRCYHTDNVVPMWKREAIAKGGVYRRVYP